MLKPRVLELLTGDTEADNPHVCFWDNTLGSFTLSGDGKQDLSHSKGKIFNGAVPRLYCIVVRTLNVNHLDSTARVFSKP